MTYEGLSSVKNLDAYQDGGIPASTIAWDSGIQNAYDLTSGVRVVDMTTDNSEGQKLTILIMVSGRLWRMSISGITAPLR